MIQMKKYAVSFVLLFLLTGFSVEKPWTELILIGNSGCSSELQPGDPFEGVQGPYGVHNLFDNDPATAWVEGVKGYGTGEYFIMDLGYALPEKLSIRNGYQKSESVFRKNSRVKSAEITLFVGFHISGEVTEIAEIYKVKQAGSGNVVELKDKMGIQEIALPYDIKAIFRERADHTEEFRNVYRERMDEVKIYDPENMTPVYLHYFLKFEIKAVYPGSAWDDTCISDFMPGGMVTDPLSSDEIIRKIYLSKENDYILFDTDIRTKMVLVDMKDLIEYKEIASGVKMALALMDVSTDMEWAQVDFMFSAPGTRVEEYPVLYHIRSGSRIGEDLLGNTTGMYGFSENDGRIWLETDQGQLDLGKIKKSLTEKK
jgi:hypothetical protein